MTSNRTKTYGIVEGFFSAPHRLWTPLERLNTISFMAQYCPHLNTYFYCPKDDPYVTKQWNRRYPPAKLKHLNEVFSICHKNQINLVYGLNPSFNTLEVKRNFNHYIQFITQKLKQITQLGISNICILYDDIPFAYNVTEQHKERKDYQVGQLHGQIMHQLQQQFLEISFWFCPPDYFFTKISPYLKGLTDYLSPDIPLCWTGDQIFTGRLTNTMLKQALKAINRQHQLIWWDNYPVNDCEHPMNTYHIGAFNGPSGAIKDQLKGMLMNPMREAAANYPAYLTMESYLCDPSKYNRTRALRQSFAQLFESSAQPHFRIYTAFAQKNAADGEPRSYLKQLLSAQSSAAARQIISRLATDLTNAKKHLVVGPAAQGFLKATYTIISQAQAFYDLSSSLLSKQNNWPRHFREFDSFPVVLKKTYLTKIVSVAKLRADASLVTQNHLGTLKALHKEYLGLSRLTISKTDELRLLRAAQGYIKSNQARFIDSIKDKTPLTALKQIIRRHYTNGY